MKKILLILVCVLSTLTASAQYASDASGSFFSTERSDQPVTFGIRGGVNLAKISESYDGYSASTKNYTGFNVGVSVDIPMLQSLYLQSGLYYTVKGAKIDEVKCNPSYLEIPVLASYRYNFSDAVQLQINVGPYFAYGVGGKWKDTEYDDEEDFFGDDFKRFDAGLAFGGGLTFSHIYVGINYDLGLTNIMKGDDDGSTKNRCLSINVGYNF